MSPVREPRLTVVRHEVDGIRRTLTEWAAASGIPKTTLHHRVTRGLSMAEAVGKGRSNARPRAPRVRSKAAAEGAAERSGRL
jgi:hypothetical protein